MKRSILMLSILIALLTACIPKEPPPSLYSELISENNITEEDQRSLSEFSYSVLDSYFDQNIEIGEMTSSAFQKFDYEKIFITYLYQGNLRCSYGGGSSSQSNRIYFDLIDASMDCIEDERFGGVIMPGEVEDIEIVFSFFLNRSKLNYNDLDDLEKKIELGIHAIELEAGGHTVYFKESVPISHNYTLERTLERLCLKAEQEEDCYLESGADLYIYDTYSFKTNRQYEIAELYRYNLYIDLDSIDQDRLLESLQWAEQWFVNNTNPDTGRLEYMYYPSTDSYSTDDNYVRQLACLWAMAELQAFLGSDSLTDVVTTSLDYYLQSMTDGGYLDIDGDAKLAYNAFTIMALLGIEYPNRDQVMTTLADAILAQQNEDGSFNTYFDRESDSGMDFYPGEAMLALMKLYNYTEDERYLQAVHQAFPYYRDYWRSNKNTAFVPWHSQTYLLLYRAVEEQAIVEFVFEMNDWMIEHYQVLRTDYPDVHGGFPPSWPRNSTSAYMEGMNDAYTLAVLVGDEEHQDIYQQAISYAVRFILQMQYTPDNVFYLENPTLAVGGFRHSLVRNDQRNDYTQHASFALMKTYDNGIFE